jgi:PKD repeat protein
VMYGAPIPQSVLALQTPGKTKQYYLFSVEDGPGFGLGSGLYCNTIDMNANNGVGKVAVKRKPVIVDSLAWGLITATKHANGRDWWVIVPHHNNDKYFSILVQSDTILVNKHFYDTPFIRSAGATIFSPNGQYYAHIVSESSAAPAFITLFNFDRCSGVLTNQKEHHLYDPLHFIPGINFSPNSRYLYALDDRDAYQYDLNAPDIFASETLVAEWDGTRYYNIWPTNFMYGQLAPDGRIYVNNSNASVTWHRIRYPNRKGMDCAFVQNDIATPNINEDDMPNHPNYRLGPIDGSACDTLGLDNHPLARFRWDFEDTISPLRVTFSDLSAYEPDQWTWYFGDGTVLDTTASGEVMHSFPSPGTYTVCLVATNGYSSDTVCHTIQIGTVSASEPVAQQVAIAAYPNPSPQDFTLHVPGTAEWQRVDVELSDLHGRAVLRTAWRGSAGSVSGRELAGGVYFARVTVEGEGVGTVRLVKI